MIISHENSSDESEVSDSFTNARTCFRVSICLRRYFKDHRARCYMQVTRNRRVRWLEKRIQKVFSLSQIFCLCSNGHLLPSTEPLALLEPGDCIEVIPVKKRNEKDLQTENECLIGSNVLSETTQPILTENSTLFGHEILKINAFSSDNENKSQNSKVDLDINNTKLNSSIDHSRNIELISHNMVTDQSASTSLINKCKDIYKQTTYDEADGAIKTLQQVKQQALQLLEGDSNATSSEPPRRVRRRVRRRPRCAASPAISIKAPLPPPYYAPTPRPPHLRFSSPPPSPLTLSPLAPRCSSPLEVERNEETTVRLPRVIRPLGIDD